MKKIETTRQATELLDAKVIGYQEWASRVLGEDYRDVYSDEYLRRAARIFSIFINKAANDEDGAADDKDEVQSIKDATEELVKERKKLQVANLEYHENMRLEARNDMMREKIAASISHLEPFHIRPFAELPKLGASGLLCLSDFHAGSTYEIRGLYDEILNAYNFDIMKGRMESLLNRLCNEDNSVMVDDMTVAILGDVFENILRPSSLVKLREPVIDMVMRFSEYLADWIVALHERLEMSVTIALVGGNHDCQRLLGSKPQFEGENLVKIVVWYLQERLKGIDGITVDPYTDCAIKMIRGNSIMLHHGYGGDIAETMRYFENLYNIDVDEVFCGHLHGQAMKNAGITELGDKLCWRVGSICGVDTYAKSIRKAARPSCMFTQYTQDGPGWRKTFYL